MSVQASPTARERATVAPLPRTRRTMGVLAILGALSLLPATALAQCQAEDPIGYVERFSGDWSVEPAGSSDQVKVRRGTCVGRDDRLRLTGPVAAPAASP